MIDGVILLRDSNIRVRPSRETKVSDTKRACILLFNEDCEGIKWTEGFLFEFLIEGVVKEDYMFIGMTTPMCIEHAIFQGTCANTPKGVETNHGCVANTLII